VDAPCEGGKTFDRHGDQDSLPDVLHIVNVMSFGHGSQS
jgi:hypothetical protein